MIAPPVPSRRPPAPEVAAPRSAPAPPAAAASPSWNGLRPSVSRAYGASTVPRIALAANHTWVEPASTASPERAVDPPHPLADLAAQVRDAARRGRQARRVRSVSTATAENDVRRRVDEHRQRCADQRDQQPGQGRTRGLRDGVRAVDARVRALQVLARHQARQEGLRGGVVDQRRGAEGGHDDDEQRQGQDVEGPGQRDDARAARRGPGRWRPSADAGAPGRPAPRRPAR